MKKREDLSQEEEEQSNCSILSGIKDPETKESGGSVSEQTGIREIINEIEMKSSIEQKFQGGTLLCHFCNRVVATEKVEIDGLVFYCCPFHGSKKEEK